MTRSGGLAATRRAVAARGAVAVVADALDLLADAPTGVLIGPPLREHALAAAAVVDPDRFPLAGVPYVVKDNIDVAGHPTTAACPGFSYVAGRDATVVARLAAAGAVCVGKANLDQFATGLVGTRSPYGTPPNVLDADVVPGGSSSGSAAAVALGLVPFAVGTDTAGSGRVPAALNGIVGLKPSVGRVDTAGFVPAVRRFDCPSVFAHDIADAAAVLHVMARRPAASTPTRSFVVGVASCWPEDVDLAPAIATGYDRACRDLVAAGATIVPVDVRPALDVGRMLYATALLAERAEAAGPPVAAGVEGLDPTVAAIIERALAFDAADHAAAVTELGRRRDDADRALAAVDVLALPTAPSAPTLVETAADPFGTNERLGVLTTFANLLGRPVAVVPDREPEPAVALQLVGRAGADDALLAVAGAYAEARTG